MLCVVCCVVVCGCVFVLFVIIVCSLPFDVVFCCACCRFTENVVALLLRVAPCVLVDGFVV